MGTNTAHSTSTMAMTGPVTSCMALMAASRAVTRLLAHDALDVLEHDDGVVHHDADGEHHAEERERVDGVAEQQQPGERPDERHRHGRERDEGGAPVLQEEEHHQEHSTIASARVFTTSRMDTSTNRVVS